MIEEEGEEELDEMGDREGELSDASQDDEEAKRNQLTRKKSLSKVMKVMR